MMRRGARLQNGIYKGGRVRLDWSSRRARLNCAQGRQSSQYDLVKWNWQLAPAANCGSKSFQHGAMPFVLAES